MAVENNGADAQGCERDGRVKAGGSDVEGGVVEEMFAWRLAGASCREIAWRLNEIIDDGGDRSVGMERGDGLVGGGETETG